MVAASQHSHLSDKLLGVSSSVSVTRLSCKSVDRILDRKNQPIDDETDFSMSPSDNPE